MNSKIALCLITLVLAKTLFAEPLPVTDSTKQANGLILLLKTGAMQISVVGRRTFHVVYSPDGTLPTGVTGFAVTSEPGPGEFTETDAADSITLGTTYCSVQVNRQTGALTFLDAAKQTFLQEVADGGKSLEPTPVAGIQTNTIDQKFVLDPTEGIFGLGQHPTGVMNYVGSTVHLEQKNTDTAVPVLVSSKGYGVFWNNPAITDVIISPSNQTNPTVEWKSEFGKKIDYYVFYGPELDQVVADYRELTGGVPMFGRWAWGYWQCKEHYNTQKELLDVAAKYRQMKVPIDGIIQDLFYWNPHPWGSHQFDDQRYPDPAAMTKTLHDEDVHIIISVWGKFEAGSSNVEDLLQYGDLLASLDREVEPIDAGKGAETADKLSKMILKHVRFSRADITQVVSYLNGKSREIDPERKGVKILLLHLDKAAHREISGISLDGINVSQFLTIITGQTNMEYIVGDGVVYLAPVNAVFDLPKKKPQYYDPFRRSSREHYWGQVDRELFADGFDGWLLDASEPELNGNWGEFRNYTTAAGPGAEVYNAYPLEHTTAVYEGMHGADPSKRVFILTRSAYAGQQRNAAVTWSGDIQGTWDVFAKQIPDGLNFTYSGIPYWNTDTGGFFGGDPHDPAYAELFTRWYQFSAFCPMFRVHGTNQPKEMWRFPNATEKILIDYDRLRYHLLPYIYSVAWKVTHENYTMMRGLAMDFPHDPKVYNIPDQYMFGPALLVNPVTKSEFLSPATTPASDWINAGKATHGARDVYLPEGKWIDFWTGRNIAGGQTIKAPAAMNRLPLYVRAGSIIPYGPEVQNAMVPEDPIELRVYRGADGAFMLYEDENDNYNYEKGAYATILFSWNEKEQVLTIGARSGRFLGMLEKRTFRIVWVSPGHGAGLDSTARPDDEVSYTGEEVRVPVSR